MEAHLDQYIYTATSIDDNTKQSIVVPTGGKKMTNAEFQEMVQKQTEMMKRGTGDYKYCLILQVRHILFTADK